MPTLITFVMLLVFTLLAFGLYIGMGMQSKKGNYLARITTTVEIVDGAVNDGFADGENWEFPIKPTKAGKYTFRAE